MKIWFNDQRLKKCFLIVFLLWVCYFMCDVPVRVALHNLRGRGCCHFCFSVCDVICFSSLYIFARTGQPTDSQCFFFLTIERLNELHSQRRYRHYFSTESGLLSQQCASWMLVVFACSFLNELWACQFCCRDDFSVVTIPFSENSTRSTCLI